MSNRSAAVIFRTVIEAIDDNHPNDPFALLKVLSALMRIQGDYDFDYEQLGSKSVDVLLKHGFIIDDPRDGFITNPNRK